MRHPRVGDYVWITEFPNIHRVWPGTYLAIVIEVYGDSDDDDEGEYLIKPCHKDPRFIHYAIARKDRVEIDWGMVKS